MAPMRTGMPTGSTQALLMGEIGENAIRVFIVPESPIPAAEVDDDESSVEHWSIRFRPDYRGPNPLGGHHHDRI